MIIFTFMLVISNNFQTFNVTTGNNVYMYIQPASFDNILPYECETLAQMQ